MGFGRSGPRSPPLPTTELLEPPLPLPTGLVELLRAIATGTHVGPPITTHHFSIENSRLHPHIRSVAPPLPPPPPRTMGGPTTLCSALVQPACEGGGGGIRARSVRGAVVALLIATLGGAWAGWGRWAGLRVADGCSLGEQSTRSCVLARTRLSLPHQDHQRRITAH